MLLFPTYGGWRSCRSRSDEGLSVILRRPYPFGTPSGDAARASVNQRHVNMGQIYHMPVEANLEAGCMLGADEPGDGFPLMGN